MGQVKNVKVGDTLLVPGVPSCLGLERGGNVPLMALEEKVLEAVGKQYTEDLLKKRAEQVAAEKDQPEAEKKNGDSGK